MQFSGSRYSGRFQGRKNPLTVFNLYLTNRADLKYGSYMSCFEMMGARLAPIETKTPDQDASNIEAGLTTTTL